MKSQESQVCLTFDSEPSNELTSKPKQNSQPSKLLRVIHALVLLAALLFGLILLIVTFSFEPAMRTKKSELFQFTNALIACMFVFVMIVIFLLSICQLARGFCQSIRDLFEFASNIRRWFWSGNVSVNYRIE